ncbi:MAG: RNA-binding protein [Chitinophagaceae bacterium]|jgi:RNA recognition motif-containing protein|nr:RNA-binding protein [Chitinophagaceae bacterium]MBP6588636.1 RNA-binding protein [Chitinophagaceae bacterium]
MNMYVSNLGYQTSEDDLRQLFEAFGQVSSAKVITDRETGKSRGFGFVEMPSGAEANEAMSKLNGKEVEGRTISVTVAREKENRPDKKRW